MLRILISPSDPKYEQKLVQHFIEKSALLRTWNMPSLPLNVFLPPPESQKKNRWKKHYAPQFLGLSPSVTGEVSISCRALPFLLLWEPASGGEGREGGTRVLNSWYFGNIEDLLC